MSSGAFRTGVLGGIFALVTYAGSASAQLILSASHTDASCNGANNGTATAQITQNGVAPFSYSWSPSGGTNATATGLTAGTYTVTVTDNNGLQGTASTTVGQPETLSGTQSQINPVGGNNGSATVVATGGLLATLTHGPPPVAQRQPRQDWLPVNIR
ncbi:hypothetical protein ACHFCA_15865 [Delftia tsuruhatensis]